MSHACNSRQSTRSPWLMAHGSWLVVHFQGIAFVKIQCGRNAVALVVLVV